MAKTTSSAVQAAWMARARKCRPDDVPDLLARLDFAVPVRVSPKPWVVGGSRLRLAAWCARLEALAGFDDDPRIAHALVQVLVRAPFESGDPETGQWLYGPAIDLLERIADGSSVAPLQALLESPMAKTKNLRDYLASRLPGALAKISAGAPASSTLPENPTAPASPRAEVSDLLDAVLANPDDEAPRVVLGDAWLEQGDPRGELMALQLANPVDHERVKALVRHDEAWIGAELARVTRARQYHRGLLDGAELAASSAADARVWSRATTAPGLASIRVLTKGAASEKIYLSFVLSPAMRSLRKLAIVSARMLDAVAGSARAAHLEEIVLEVEPTAQVLRSLAPFTRLRRLVLRPRPGRPYTIPEVVARLAGWSGRAGLVEIALEQLGDGSFLLAHDALAPVPSLALVRRWATAWSKAVDVRVAIHRDARGRALEVATCGNIEGVWSTLATVGRVDRATFRILGDPREQDVSAEAVRRALKELGVPLTALPDAWQAA